MQYIPSFETIKRNHNSDFVLENGSVIIKYELFCEVIRDLLLAAQIDEAWYLAQYPDVLQSGMSAQRHFAEHGYFEGRLPSDFSFDEEWYLATYTDVADQIAAGVMPDALTHFRDHGYAEGRKPGPF